MLGDGFLEHAQAIEDAYVAEAKTGKPPATYFDDFLEFLWDYVCTEEPLITGVVGDAEALIFSSLRHVPVAVSVESSAVLCRNQIFNPTSM